MMKLWNIINLKQGGAGVTPVLTVSLTSAVAPFGVVFDGVGTTVSSGDAFHDYIYYFDFGDANAAVYSNGQLAGQTKNRFVGGPVAAFVYETPGTYTAKMWVSDGTSVWGPVSQSITVTDPDVVYGNANTWYIHDTTLPVAGVGGVPAGATNLFVQSSYSTACNTYGAKDRRILFCSGRSFTWDTSVTQNTTGKNTNRYFGTYGGTAQATINATANSMNFLGISNNTNVPANNPQNWRVINLKFVSTGFTTGNAGVSCTAYPVTTAVPDMGTFSAGDGGLTVYKCTAVDIPGSAFVMGGAGNVIAACSTYRTAEQVGQGGGGSLYGTSNLRFGVIDNSFDNWHGGEHCIRSQGASYEAIISNYTARCALNKVYITLRGFAAGADATGLWAEYRNCAYNTLDATNQTLAKETTGPLNVAPQNSSVNEPIRNVILEGNFINNFVLNFGTAISLTARQSSVRNNVVKFESTTTGIPIGVQLVNPNGTQSMISAQHRIYNNTMYKSTTNGFSFIQIASAVDTTDIKGNVVYAPLCLKNGNNNGSQATLFSASSVGTNVTSSNNSTDSQIKNTDPLFVGPLTTMAGFRVASGSYAKNAGIDTKVRADALSNIRAGASFDMGAVNESTHHTQSWQLVPTAYATRLFCLKLSNPTNAVITDDIGCGTIQTNPIIPSVNVSRTTGKAPLAIGFDATGTTCGTTTNPGHDLYYIWNFGDAAGETWAYGAVVGNDKNVAYGNVAGHVFKTAGAYTWQLLILDGNGNTAVKTGRVVVSDWLAADTIYINNGSVPAGGVNGALSGATYYNETTWAGVVSRWAANKRIMLRRGDTWACGATSYIPNGCEINSYGTGTFAFVTSAGATMSPFSNNTGASDTRICNIKHTGPGPNIADSEMATTSITAPSNILLLGLESSSSTAGFISAAPSVSNVFIQDCYFHDYGDTGISTNIAVYITNGYGVYLLGSFFDRAPSHVVRISGAQKLKIESCKIRRPDGAGNGRDALTVREIAGSPTTTWSGLYTEDVIISNNDIDASGTLSDWTVQVAQTNQQCAGWFRRVLIERNHIVSDKQCLALAVSEQLTVRNNILRTLNYSQAMGLGVSNDGVTTLTPANPNPAGGQLYNNTIYKTGTGAFTAINLGTTSNGTNVTGTVVRNNLAYAPNAASPVLLTNTGSVSGSVVSNNSSDAQVASVRPWAATTPVSPTNYTPNSYAIGGGISSVREQKDFFNTSISGNPAIGAISV